MIRARVTNSKEEYYLELKRTAYNIYCSPFEYTDLYNDFHFATWLRNYNLGNEDFDDIEEFLEEYPKSNYVIRKVYAYIHSGISLSFGNSEYPFNDKWYSGFAGLIAIPKENYRELEERLDWFIQEYNLILAGSEYEADLIKQERCPHCGHISEDCIDSVCGILTDSKEDALVQACEAFNCKIV